MHTSPDPETTHHTPHHPTLSGNQILPQDQQEINCKYIEVIAFYPKTGNLYEDKPANVNNTDIEEYS